jgi:hypothetical protein
VHVIKTSQIDIYSFFLAQPNALLHSVPGRLGSAMAKNKSCTNPPQVRLRECERDNQAAAATTEEHLWQVFALCSASP